MKIPVRNELDSQAYEYRAAWPHFDTARRCLLLEMFLVYLHIPFGQLVVLLRRFLQLAPDNAYTYFYRYVDIFFHIQKSLFLLNIFYSFLAVSMYDIHKTAFAFLHCNLQVSLARFNDFWNFKKRQRKRWIYETANVKCCAFWHSDLNLFVQRDGIGDNWIFVLLILHVKCINVYFQVP